MAPTGGVALHGRHLTLLPAPPAPRATAQAAIVASAHATALRVPKGLGSLQGTLHEDGALVAELTWAAAAEGRADESLLRQQDTLRMLMHAAASTSEVSPTPASLLRRPRHPPTRPIHPSGRHTTSPAQPSPAPASPQHAPSPAPQPPPIPPQTLTLHIHDCASVPRLLGLVQRHQQHLNPFHVAAALTRLARLLLAAERSRRGRKLRWRAKCRQRLDEGGTDGAGSAHARPDPVKHGRVRAQEHGGGARPGSSDGSRRRGSSGRQGAEAKGSSSGSSSSSSSGSSRGRGSNGSQGQPLRIPLGQRLHSMLGSGGTAPGRTGPGHQGHQRTASTSGARAAVADGSPSTVLHPLRPGHGMPLLGGAGQHSGRGAVGAEAQGRVVERVSFSPGAPTSSSSALTSSLPGGEAARGPEAPGLAQGAGLGSSGGARGGAARGTRPRHLHLKTFNVNSSSTRPTLLRLGLRLAPKPLPSGGPGPLLGCVPHIRSASLLLNLLLKRLWAFCCATPSFPTQHHPHPLSSSLDSILYALALLRHRDSGLLHALLAAVLAEPGGMHALAAVPRAAARVMWSLAKLGCRPRARWLAAFYEATRDGGLVSEDDGEGGNGHRGLVLRGEGRLAAPMGSGVSHRGSSGGAGTLRAASACLSGSNGACSGLNGACSHVRSDADCSASSDGAQRQRAAALAVTLWALARLRCRPPPPWMHAAAASVHARLPWTKAGEGVLAAWGLARIGYQPSPAQVSALANRCLEGLPGLDLQRVTAMLESLATLGFWPWTTRLYQVLLKVQACAASPVPLTPHGVSSLLRASTRLLAHPWLQRGPWLPHLPPAPWEEAAHAGGTGSTSGSTGSIPGSSVGRAGGRRPGSHDTRRDGNGAGSSGRLRVQGGGLGGGCVELGPRGSAWERPIWKAGVRDRGAHAVAVVRARRAWQEEHGRWLSDGREAAPPWERGGWGVRGGVQHHIPSHYYDSWLHTFFFPPLAEALLLHPLSPHGTHRGSSPSSSSFSSSSSSSSPSSSSSFSSSSSSSPAPSSSSSSRRPSTYYRHRGPPSLYCYSTHELVQVLWSLAKMHVRPPSQWMRAALNSFVVGRRGKRRLDFANSQDVSKLMYSLAVLRLRPNPAWLSVLFMASRPKLAAFNPQHLANLLWAIAQLHVQPPLPWLLRFAWEVHQRVGDFNIVELTQLQQGLGLMAGEGASGNGSGRRTQAEEGGARGRAASVRQQQQQLHPRVRALQGAVERALAGMQARRLREEQAQEQGAQESPAVVQRSGAADGAQRTRLSYSS